MKIICNIQGYYKDHTSKIYKDRWQSVEEWQDINDFKEQGFATEFELSISAIDEREDCKPVVLTSYRFQKTGNNTRRNISFLGNTFQYDEKTGEIVYINRIINI
jgi:hypothetical protein